MSMDDSDPNHIQLVGGINSSMSTSTTPDGKIPTATRIGVRYVECGALDGYWIDQNGNPLPRYSPHIPPNDEPGFNAPSSLPQCCNELDSIRSLLAYIMEIIHDEQLSENYMRQKITREIIACRKAYR